ncbi:MAG TPA: hypothetical protein VMH83_06460, partial [Candidatus Acidoferrum sp.]|nr:hypothetical protein [Candidatus Acidoferrum sp.]
KSAYATLAANSPNASDPNSPMAQLGKALAAGDMNAAQQAFAAAGAHHHHHHGAGNTASGTASTTAAANPPLATSGTLGTTVNAVA